jgi:hypothetical protein
MNTSQDPDLKFRCSLWTGMLSGIVWGGLTCCLMSAPLCFFLTPRFRYPAWSVYITLCLFGLLFGVIAGGFYALTCPVLVRRDGICGYNFWGSYSMVLWDDFIDIKSINCLGFSYLKASFEGSTAPLWIPLFLTEKNKFAAAVIEHAPEGNPLRGALSGDFRTSATSDKPLSLSRSLPKDSQNLMESLTQSAKDFKHLIVLSLHLMIHPHQLCQTIYTYYFTIQSPPHPQPWMQPTIFPTVPISNTFGYQRRKKIMPALNKNCIGN